MAVIRYLVDDVDRAVAFYTEHLGFFLERRMGPAFAIVSLGDLALWLSGPQSSAARSMPDARQPEPGGWNRLVIEVDDLWISGMASSEARAEAGRSAIQKRDRHRAGRQADPARGHLRQSRGVVRTEGLTSSRPAAVVCLPRGVTIPVAEGQYPRTGDARQYGSKSWARAHRPAPQAGETFG